MGGFPFRNQDRGQGYEVRFSNWIIFSFSIESANLPSLAFEQFCSSPDLMARMCDCKIYDAQVLISI